MNVQEQAQALGRRELAKPDRENRASRTKGHLGLGANEQRRIGCFGHDDEERGALLDGLLNLLRII